MALRVLLADESHTIKKVFQLALQDYAVEVRPVNIGLDVLSVAKKFKPDIVFADVLLQKKSGYEVCAELKNDPEMKNIPVILMWSGFMDLDDDKVQASGANSKLEKPFDVNALRSLVQEFVEKTKTQRLSGFLSFPDRPDFEEPAKPEPQAEPPPTPEAPTTGSPWNMESFDPIDQFKTVPLKKPDGRDHDLDLISSQGEEGPAQWQQKTLGNFKVQVDDTADSDLPVDYVVPEESIEAPRGMFRTGETPPPQKQVLQWEQSNSQAAEPYIIDAASRTFEYRGPSNPSIPQGPEPELDVETVPKPEPSQVFISPDQIEHLVRERAQAMIEEVVWKVVPELASRIIERELQKLLADVHDSV